MEDEDVVINGKVVPLNPDDYADHLSGNWDDVPNWVIRRLNFLERVLRINDERRCPKMYESCPDIPEYSCHTVKHCYPYLCEGGCGHNEIYVTDEEKKKLGKATTILINHYSNQPVRLCKFLHEV